MAACHTTFLTQVMISTLPTTWRGSLSTWRLLLPAEVALLQEDLVTGKIRWWPETSLTRRIVLKFVPRLISATVTQRFLYMERKARPHRTEWSWAHFTTTVVTQISTGEMKRPVLTKLSWTTISLISASVAVDIHGRSIQNSFVTRAIKIIVVGKYRITMYRHFFLVMIEAQNKSCNLGYVQLPMLYLSTCTALTLYPTPVLKGERDELEGRNLESELYVFSQTIKNFLNS